MLNVQTLSQHLVTFGAAHSPFTTKSVVEGKAQMAPRYNLSNETYGRRSMLYIGTPDMATRRKLEDFLTSKGALVNRTYWPSSCTVEVQVSYFKGTGWDE